MTESCGTCRFWQDQEKPKLPEPVGWCRRFPPSRTDEHGVMFPDMWASEWCGEYQRGEAKPNKQGASGTADDGFHL